jgi:HD-GYP domain-containing protein (c-di-GMP phosphodiesterase class II)
VLLFNPHSLRLEYASGTGMNTETLKSAIIPLSEDPAGQVVLERHRRMIADLRRETQLARAPAFAQENFVSYYGVPLIAKGQVRGVLEIFHRSAMLHDNEWLDFLEALAGQAAISIDNGVLFDELQRSNLELTLAYEASIDGWSRALDLRDEETEGHTQRVAQLTLQLAHNMNISEQELAHIRRGAMLHDIGKMGVPDAILHKPGPLNDEEWAVMRRHPVYARDMLNPIAYLRPALDIPWAHHERWDGTGYPRRLAGEDIPLAARLFSVIDVWDALRSDRPYRPAVPAGEVVRHLRDRAGTHFEPRIVELFLDTIAG